MYKGRSRSCGKASQAFRVVFCRVPDEAFVTCCPGHILNEAAESLIDDLGFT